jgi:exopolysaccharide biosynthesis protein
VPATRRLAVALALALAAACRVSPRAEIDSPALPFAVDSTTRAVVHDGVVHRYLYAPGGPWAIHVLEARSDRCWTLAALKSSGGAVGRATTSALVREAAARETVAGGVNADFFLFTPPGVPVGILVADGRVIAGPIAQPALAADSAGRSRIERFETRGHVRIGGARRPVRGWNRDVADGLAVFDREWGAATDSASRVIEIVLANDGTYRVAAVDTAPTGVPIPAGGAVLKVGRAAPDTLRAAMRALPVGTSVDLEVALAPFHPREAVGARPVLVEDGNIAARLDTVGRAGFATSRHPRTAAGITRDGARILLVTVDGRQAPYSDGMSLRELAELMRALGAYAAVNLDGGGSTALVVAQGDSFRLANRPSDAAGERAVGDAVALVRRCGR